MVLETPVLIPAALLLPPPGVVAAAGIGVAVGTAVRLANAGWSRPERLEATGRTVAIYVLVATVVAMAAPTELPDSSLELLLVILVLEVLALATALPVQIVRGHLRGNPGHVSVLAQIRPSLAVGPIAGLTAAVIIVLVQQLSWAGLIGYAPVVLVWIGGRRLVLAQQDRVRLAALHDLSLAVTGAESPDQIRSAAKDAVARIFPGASVELLADEGGPTDASADVGGGQWVVAHQRADPYRASDRAVLEIVGRMASDASGRLAQHARVERHDRIQSALLAAVGHDLQTPLTVQRGMAETLLNVGDELRPDQRIELIQRIAAAARRMSRTVAGLVDLERVELDPSGQSGNCSPVDTIRQWVDEVDLPGGHAIDLDVDPSAEDERVDLTPVQLERVVENLVFNACRHQPEGEPIVMRVFTDGGDVHVHVDDGGPGVEPENRDVIMTAFGQGTGDGPRGSVGLGLFIVGRLIDHAGGRLDIADRPGGGASFQIQLPATPPGGPARP
jgi:signal transduction histidine kinase